MHISIIKYWCCYSFDSMLQKSILRKFYFFAIPQNSLSCLLMSSSPQYPRPGQKYVRPKALQIRIPALRPGCARMDALNAKW